MSEQGFMSEEDKIAKEKTIEEKIGIFLKENRGAAFTIKAISNRLEAIIKDTDQLEYAKKNLQEILNRMASDRTIITVDHIGETHYSIEKVEKKAPNAREIDLEPLKSWIRVNSTSFTGWLILLGIAVGLISFLSGIINQILIPFSVIFVTVTVLIEIATASQQTKESSKYRPPIYGIVSLAFAVFGIILLTTIRSSYYSGFEMLYATPISIVALIGGAAGLYGGRDDSPVGAISGLFLGGIVLIISLWPVLYYLFSFVAIFIH